MRIVIRGDDFRQGVSMCRNSVNTDKIRTVLMKVCIRIYDDGNIEMTALDGFHMVTYYCKAMCWSESRFDKYEFLLDPVTIPKDAPSVAIDDDGDAITISYGDTIQTQPKTDDKYLDYTRLMQTDDPTFQITVNPKILMQALKACKGEKNVVLSLYSPVKPMMVDGESVRCIVLPVRNTDEKLGMAKTRHITHE